jgi:hypothetical protein
LKLEDPKIVENFNKLRLKHLGTTQATTIQKEMEAALLENNQYIKQDTLGYLHTMLVAQFSR